MKSTGRAEMVALEKLMAPTRKPNNDEVDQLIQMYKEEDVAAGRPALEDSSYGYAASDLLQGEDFGQRGREDLRRFRAWQKKRGLKPPSHIRLA